MQPYRGQWGAWLWSKQSCQSTPITLPACLSVCLSVLMIVFGVERDTCPSLRCPEPSKNILRFHSEQPKTQTNQQIMHKWLHQRLWGILLDVFLLVDNLLTGIKTHVPKRAGQTIGLSGEVKLWQPRWFLCKCQDILLKWSTNKQNVFNTKTLNYVDFLKLFTKSELKAYHWFQVAILMQQCRNCAVSASPWQLRCWPHLCAVKGVVLRQNLLNPFQILTRWSLMKIILKHCETCYGDFSKNHRATHSWRH